MTALLICALLYAAAMTALYLIAQTSADELQADNLKLGLVNANLRAENQLLRRDVARAYRHPSTLARVVDLDERRGLR